MIGELVDAQPERISAGYRALISEHKYLPNREKVCHFGLFCSSFSDSSGGGVLVRKSLIWWSGGFALVALAACAIALNAQEAKQEKVEIDWNKVVVVSKSTADAAGGYESDAESGIADP